MERYFLTADGSGRFAGSPFTVKSLGWTVLGSTGALMATRKSVSWVTTVVPQGGWLPITEQGASLGVGVTVAVGVAVAVAVAVAVGVAVAVAVGVGDAVGVGVGVPLREAGRHKPYCHWRHRCFRERRCQCSICACRTSIVRRPRKSRRRCRHCSHVTAHRLGHRQPIQLRCLFHL